MTTSTSRRRFTRAAALVGSAAIIASAGVGWNALSASAAFSGQPYATQFEIDGNTAVNGGQDWASSAASAPNLHGAPFETSELCGGQDPDPNRVIPGTKIDDILVDAPPVAPGNVNTKPEKTLDAVADHGEVVGDTITPIYGDAQKVLDDLEALGISYNDVVQVLEVEGVEKFDKSWGELLEEARVDLEKAAQKAAQK